MIYLHLLRFVSQLLPNLYSTIYAIFIILPCKAYRVWRCLSLKERLALLIAVLLTCVFMVGAATGIQRTVVSLYVKERELNMLFAFLPLVSFGLFKGVLGLLGGPLCDNIGRRKALLAGLATYSAGLAIILALPTTHGFILGNAFIGAGEGLVFLAAMTAMADIYGAEEAGLTFGVMESLAYAGYGCGSFIAGLLWEWQGALAPFTYALVWSMIIMVLALVKARETKQLSEKEGKKWGEEEISTTEAYISSLKKPSLLTTYASAHVAKMGDALVWTAFPILLASRGYTKGEIGFLQGLVTISWALTMPLWGRLSDKLGRKALIAAGFALYSLGLLLMLEPRSLSRAALAALLVGNSSGMFYPLLPAVTADLAPFGARGRVLGLYRSIRDLGYLTGALFLGLTLSTLGFAGPFYVVAALSMTLAVLSLTLVRETRPFWPFFELVVEHASIIREVLELNGELLRAVRDGDVERARVLAKRVKELEREADRLRREIMDRIWSSPLPLGDRMDFERLVDVVDRVAGHVLESHERLFRIDLLSVPRPLLEGLVELNTLTTDAASVFVEDIKMLRKSPRIAAKLADDVDKAETKVDLLRMRLLDSIRGALTRGEIDVLTAIDLRDTIDLLEDVADELEDASDIIRIISIKHAR